MRSISLLVSLLLLLGCGKSDELAPVILLISPEENQAFNGGQEIQIKATITDNEGIHMVHLIVTDIPSGGHMVHFEDHFDGKTYELNKSFPTIAGRSYKIELDATDHSGNKGKKEITVFTN